MAALFVAVAHSGKTLQLGVQPAQRVEAVQQALVAFTGVPVADQILMLAGTKLEGSRALSMYKLPWEDPSVAADHPVVLYCKSYLRPDGPIPTADVLQPITPRVPPPLSSATVTSSVASHPLCSSQHQAVRALPVHEATFSHHVAKAAAYLDASLARLQRCRQLLSEQEVQSRAADAATTNVESHYAFISSAMASFLKRYGDQCTEHAQLLTSFSEDQALLDSIPLVPGLQAATAAKRLSELPGAVRAREVAAACRKHHGQFAEKVSQLEGLYDSMKLDMEALIMQAPTVDLDALGVQLTEAEGWIEEQTAIVKVLRKDLDTLQSLVEKVVRQSAAGGAAALAPGGDGGALLDACVAVGALAAAHETTQLPRVEALDAALAVLEERCVAAKSRMTVDVINMLRCISQQQSKIRDMRSRLAGFDALLQRQAAMFNELRPLGRLPAAYRGLLAECERVRAWHQYKSSQVTEFVDRLVVEYQAESRRRRASVQQFERYIPTELISAAGLDEASSLGIPTVTIPLPPSRLLPVSLADVQRLPSGTPGVTAAMTAMSRLLTAGPRAAAGDAAGAASSEKMLPLSQLVDGGDGDAGESGPYAPPLPDPTSMHRLEMENARLRAELAGLLVDVSLARLAAAPTVAAGAASTILQTAAGSASVSRGLGASQLSQPPIAPPTPAGLSPAASAPPASDAPRGLTASLSWRRQNSQGSGAATPAGGTAGGAAIPLAHSRSNSQQLSGSQLLPSAASMSGAAAAPIPPSPHTHATPSPGGTFTGPSSLPRASTMHTVPSTHLIPPLSPGLQSPAPAAAGGGDAAGARPASLEAVAALQQAASAKDALCAALQHEVRALTRRVSTYEDRIIHLEEQLAKKAATCSVHGTDLQPPTDNTDTQPQPPQPAAAAADGALAAAAAAAALQGSGMRASGSSTVVDATQHDAGPVGAASGSQQGRAAAAAAQSTTHIETSEDFDPLASSSYGGEQGPHSGQLPTTQPGAGTQWASKSGEVMAAASEVAGAAAAAATPAALVAAAATLAGLVTVGQQPTTPMSAGGLAASAALASVAFASAPTSATAASAAKTSPQLILGPIALAAMGGSRGQTPEPGQTRFASAHCSAGGSSGGATSSGGAPLGPVPAVAAHAGGSEGGADAWSQGAAGLVQPPTQGATHTQGSWVAHPNPLFQGPWGAPALRFQSLDSVTAAASMAAAAAVAEPRTRSADAADGAGGVAVAHTVATTAIDAHQQEAQSSDSTHAAQAEQQQQPTEAAQAATDSVTAATATPAQAAAESSTDPASHLTSAPAPQEPMTNSADSVTSTSATPSTQPARDTVHAADSTGLALPQTASVSTTVSQVVAAVFQAVSPSTAPGHDNINSGENKDDGCDSVEEDVPDINDVLAATDDAAAAAAATSVGGTGAAHAAAAAAAAAASSGGVGAAEVRTWPAAGSGLGASMLLDGGASAAEDVTAAAAAAGIFVPAGALGPGNPMAQSGHSASGSESMYASAMGGASIMTTTGTSQRTSPSKYR